MHQRMNFNFNRTELERAMPVFDIEPFVRELRTDQDMERARRPAEDHYPFTYWFSQESIERVTDYAKSLIPKFSLHQDPSTVFYFEITTDNDIFTASMIQLFKEHYFCRHKFVQDMPQFCLGSRRLLMFNLTDIQVGPFKQFAKEYSKRTKIHSVMVGLTISNPTEYIVTNRCFYFKDIYDLVEPFLEVYIQPILEVLWPKISAEIVSLIFPLVQLGVENVYVLLWILRCLPVFEKCKEIKMVKVITNLVESYRGIVGRRQFRRVTRAMDCFKVKC